MDIGLLIILLLGGAIAYFAYTAYSGIKQRQAVEDALTSVPGFRPTQHAVADNHSGIAIDERSDSICFAEWNTSTRSVDTHVVSSGDVISSEIAEDKAAVTEKGFAGITTTAMKVSQLYLKTVVNNTRKPTHITRFYSAPPAIDSTSSIYQSKLSEAQHWHGLLTVSARRAEKLEQFSPADELHKLSALKAAGILTEDEWTRSKELYLGKSPDRREQSVQLLRDLHALFARGALSESEFNGKKWEVLSRNDL